jgi:hypothetical protein
MFSESGGAEKLMAILSDDWICGESKIAVIDRK